MKNMTLEVPRWMMRLLVASATTMVVIGWFGMRSLGVKADWLAFYAAGSFTLQGELSQIYDAAVIQAWEEPLIGANIIRFLYAPAYATTFVPLAFMPVQAARYSWLVVGVLASLLASRLSTRWSGLSTPLSALALLAFPPLAYSLAIGQISPITLLVFTFVASQEWQ
ncbi:MAG: glycosyltransferase family 87 protein, partial [Anaerolineales bacterium]